jgi:hypothetical protein
MPAGRQRRARFDPTTLAAPIDLLGSETASAGRRRVVRVKCRIVAGDGVGQRTNFEGSNVGERLALSHVEC